MAGAVACRPRRSWLWGAATLAAAVVIWLASLHGRTFAAGHTQMSHLVRVLDRIALACPICAVPEDTQMTAGVRAGALVLIIVTIAVLGTIGTFFVRQWRAERK